MVKNAKFTINVSQSNRCAERNGVTPAADSPHCSVNVECTGDFAGRACLADGDKLRRDLTRVTDARALLRTLRTYRNGAGGFPKLTEASASAGSFVPYFTTSKWSSWQSALGNTLGTVAPIDPVNRFIGCSADNGYDAETCWNKDTKSFTCNGGNVYQYRTLADAQTSEIWMNFEFFNPQEQRELSSRIADAAGDGATVRYGACVEGEIQGVNQVVNTGVAACGNGQKEGAELCDDGAENGRYGGYCSVACNGYTGYCGDHRVDENELCDSSAVRDARGQHYPAGVSWARLRQGSCGWDCRSYGLYCGDGVTDERYESCDDGNIVAGDGCNAECRVEPLPPAVCGNGRIEQGEQCDGGDRCNPNCTVIGAYCGNGKPDPGELCDEGVRNGVACTGEYGRQCSYCSANCKNILFASGPYCGDGHLDAPNEVCDGASGFSCWDKERSTLAANAIRCISQCSTVMCDDNNDGQADEDRYVLCKEGDNCVRARITIAAAGGDTDDAYTFYFGPKDSPIAQIGTKAIGAANATITLPAVPLGDYTLRIFYANTQAPDGSVGNRGGRGNYSLSITPEPSANERLGRLSFINEPKALTSLPRTWESDQLFKTNFLDDHWFADWVAARYDGRTNLSFKNWLTRCRNNGDGPLCIDTTTFVARDNRRRVVQPRALNNNGLRLRTEAEAFDGIRSTVAGNPARPGERTVVLYFDEAHSVINHTAQNYEFGIEDGGSYADFNIRIAR